MYPIAGAANLEVGPFRRRTVTETRIPPYRHTNSASVFKINGKHIVGNSHLANSGQAQKLSHRNRPNLFLELPD